MWEYKITKSDLGYNVYRIKEEDGFIKMEWLQKDTYTLNRNFARTFYHLNDATSALVIARRKGEIEETSKEKSDFEEMVGEQLQYD